jgi:hypothetical protein
LGVSRPTVHVIERFRAYDLYDGVLIERFKGHGSYYREVSDPLLR